MDADARVIKALEKARLEELCVHVAVDTPKNKNKIAPCLKRDKNTKCSGAL